MQHHIDVSAIGTVLRIPLPTENPELSSRIKTAWQDAVVADGSKHDCLQQVLIAPSLSAERVMESLSIDITLSALLMQAGELMMLHAGGVALEDGTVIAFAAPSGHGKTTLTRALAKQYGYVSDETIAVNEDLQVLPYRKPLSVVTPGKPKQQLSPRELDLQQLPANLRLGAVVLLDREGAPADANAPARGTPHLGENGRPVVRRLPLVEALSGIVAHTSYLSHLDRPLQRLAKLFNETGGFIRLTYRESADVADYLPEMKVIPGHKESWKGIEFTHATDLEVHDAIELEDGTVVVLAGSQLHVLGALGGLVWQLLVRGQNLAAVQDAVVARFGEPPAGLGESVADRVETAAADLRTAALLHSESLQSS